LHDGRVFAQILHQVLYLDLLTHGLINNDRLDFTVLDIDLLVLRMLEEDVTKLDSVGGTFLSNSMKLFFIFFPVLLPPCLGGGNYLPSSGGMY
jgi:hypothetical protein